MTGPEHYQRAEFWADSAEQAKKNDASDVAELTALGQLHATLALAAATAMGAHSVEAGPAGMPTADFDAWDRVAGVEL